MIVCECINVCVQSISLSVQKYSHVSKSIIFES